jgi:hypothetical protein
MALTEDDVSTLTTMVTDFRNLFSSFLISLRVGQTLPDDITLNTSSLAYLWDDTNQKWQWTSRNAYKFIKVEDVVMSSPALFKALADKVLLYEKTHGIKKNRIVSTDSCYIDNLTSLYYWEVSGAKAYLPAFTDTIYYSTVKVGDEYQSTKEFGFKISLPCGGSGFLEGDQIIVRIGERQTEPTYQIGDITYLPTIASQNLFCSGGVDGDDTYIFEIISETDTFANYLLNRDNPVPYVSAKLQFLINDGVVPFSVGDYFEFSVEGGRFIWRKDNGAWSSPVNISSELQVFDSGLRILFDFGASPSFVVNDTWQVKCIQSNKVANGLNLFSHLKLKGTGEITIDAGSSIPIDALVIAFHNLTSAFDFIASDSPSFSPAIYTKNITPTSIICDLPATQTARYFKLDISGDYEIGYAFLGLKLQLSLDADQVEPLNRYNIKRNSGKEPFSLHQFTQKGYIVNYSSFIYNTDYNLLEAMINYLKLNGDLPLYFVPNINYPAECIRGRVDSDNINFSSPIDMNAPQENRLFALSLPIVGSVE